MRLMPQILAQLFRPSPDPPPQEGPTGNSAAPPDDTPASPEGSSVAASRARDPVTRMLEFTVARYERTAAAVTDTYERGMRDTIDDLLKKMGQT